jgi:hypothetical protein
MELCTRPCTTVEVTGQLATQTTFTGLERHNTSVVSFVFKSLIAVKKSVPKLTILSVINDLGSSMGLWLGASLYTVFELLRGLGLGLAGRGRRLGPVLCSGFVLLAPIPTLAFAIFYIFSN